MKILYILLMFVVSFIFNSCKDKSEVLVEPTSYDFNAVIKSDYINAIESDSSVLFYEATAELDSVLDASTIPKVVKMEVIFQASDTVIQYQHQLYEFTKDPIIVKVKGYWLQDIKLDTCWNYTLDQAIGIIRSLTGDIPSSRTVTFRTPLAPPFDIHPSYIFGDTNTGFIKLNSYTGKVEQIK